MSPRPGSLSARLATRTTVLVVEDEADIAGFLGAYFRASGLELVHVNPRTPEEVADAVREHDVACVLLDLNLVGFSGLEVLATFRADPALASVPVVVVSAYTTEATRCEQLGARAFVAKPFSVSDLFESVSAIVNDAPAAAPALDDVEDQIASALKNARRESLAVTLALVRVPGGDPAHLGSALPEGSVLGRTGPDEVAVLLVGADTAVGTRILGRALAPIDGARAGVACAPEHATTTDELYMAADAALADACDSGESVVSAR